MRIWGSRFEWIECHRKRFAQAQKLEYYLEILKPEISEMEEE
jgi:hypothetical protein